MARQHHEHAGAGLAGLEQPLAMPVAAYLAKPPHAVDLVRGQRRKGLLEAWKRNGRGAGWAHTTNICHVATRLPYSDASLPSSSREALPSAEDAALLLRPRACDLRRLRFSRSASFS